MKVKEGLEEEYKTYIETNSKDDYSKGVVDYEQRWADLMEGQLVQGIKLEDIADEASHKANTEGITGFMYGCAVQSLAHFWEHGEQLRVWHNRQYSDEEGEGVINPAILTIGAKE